MKRIKNLLSLILSILMISSVFPGYIANAMTPQEGANWALSQVGKSYV